jgi:hypothetical protein
LIKITISFASLPVNEGSAQGLAPVAIHGQFAGKFAYEDFA